VALQFCGFIAYAAEAVRLLAVCISVAFLLLLVFFNSYSPQAPQSIARFLAFLFVAAGCAVVRVFVQMERDPILSRISHTTPGELNSEFWLHLVTLGGLPLVGVLGHLFPAVSRFLFQWIAPGVQAVH
jgi:hypothetical protein